MFGDNLKWAGNVPFRNVEEITLYKRVLLEYHHVCQNGLCFYCEETSPLKPAGCPTQPKPYHATIEHLEPASVTKKRWIVESPDLVRKWGDISIDNTVMACKRCNNSRPNEMNPWEYKAYVLRNKKKQKKREAGKIWLTNNRIDASVA